MRYPNAIWTPGVNAGYRSGRTTMQSVVCHYTVGRNSIPIGERGYFNFLVARDGTVYQFAEADAICWHAGTPWNMYGPGIEVEYLPGYDDELFTPEAYHSTALLVDWLCANFGLPPAFYDGPRISFFNGFITHRSLIQTGDYHSDWWPELPTDTTPTPLPPEDEDMLKPFLIEAHGGVWCYDPRTHTAKPFATPETLNTWKSIFTVSYGEPPAYKTEPEYVALLDDATRP